MIWRTCCKTRGNVVVHQKSWPHSLEVAPSERSWVEVARSGNAKQPQQQCAADQQFGTHLQVTCRWSRATLTDA